MRGFWFSLPHSSRGSTMPGCRKPALNTGITLSQRDMQPPQWYLGVDKDLPEQGLDVVVGSSHNDRDLVSGKDIFNVPQSGSVSRDTWQGGRAVGSSTLGPRPCSPSPKEPVRLQVRVIGVSHLSLSSATHTSYHQNSGTPRNCQGGQYPAQHCCSTAEIFPNQP